MKLEMFIVNFWNGRQVSGVDIKLSIPSHSNKEMIQYINKHYPEYDTITTLKTDAMNDNYNKRVVEEVEKICNLFLKENSKELEL